MSFIDEFKNFIARGNVLDMSVGVIIGGAFGKIVSSLTSDILMPPIGILMGHLNFADLHIPLITDPSKYINPSEGLETMQHLMSLPLAQVRAKGIPVIAYGSFINEVINFIIIGFCLFVLIKIISLVTAKKEAKEKAAPTVKTCPECLSEIPIGAKKCKFCASVQPTIDSSNSDKK
ncbi:MAG: large conductance mechanosensitive channel protein MscL [Candidatus Bruticola sp.]